MILLLILLTAVTAVGCANQPDVKQTDEPTAAPETQLHTVAPPEETPSVEWAAVDCEISLESSDSIYAENRDFLTFALVGSTDEDCALRFTIDEVTASMLLQQDAGIDYYLTVNKKVLKGEISFSSDFSEIIMTGGYTYGEMCELAREIRGL